MNPIRWVGSSPNWQNVPVAPKPYFLFPLVEEKVLSVAFSDLSLRKLTRKSAIACTSRFVQRTFVELACPHLNPAWEPWGWREGVWKAPASTQNEGVRFFTEPIEMVDLLRRFAPGIANIGVMEEYLPGEAFEIDGIVFGTNEFRFFHPLCQYWQGDRIIHYERVTDLDVVITLQAIAQQVAKAVELSDCPFCCEFRRTSRGWKLIEINARIGEDHAQFFAQLWERSPLAQAAIWAKEFLD